MSLEKRFNKRLIGLIMGEKYTKEEPESKPGFIETGINELKKSLKKSFQNKQNDSLIIIKLLQNIKMHRDTNQ